MIKWFVLAFVLIATTIADVNNNSLVTLPLRKIDQQYYAELSVGNDEKKTRRTHPLYASCCRYSDYWSTGELPSTSQRT